MLDCFGRCYGGLGDGVDVIAALLLSTVVSLASDVARESAGDQVLLARTIVDQELGLDGHLGETLVTEEVLHEGVNLEVLLKFAI